MGSETKNGGGSGWVLGTGVWGASLVVAYLLVSSGLIVGAPRAPRRRRYILVANLLLMACFGAFLAAGSGSSQSGGWIPLLRLWLPVIFFWWAYKWAGRTLGLFCPAGFSWGRPLVRFEEKYLGLPSLGWAGSCGKGLAELLHCFYASYYPYTPGPVICLYGTGEFRQFETLALGGALSATPPPLASSFLFSRSGDPAGPWSKPAFWINPSNNSRGTG